MLAVLAKLLDCEILVVFKLV